MRGRARGVELQNRNIMDALTAKGYDKTDFSQWMVDDRFSTLQDVRRLPDILKSKKATEVFLKTNTRDAKKILAVEEITVDKLKDVPYELLAKELSNRMLDMKMREISHLRDDSEYDAKRNALVQVYGDVKFILEEIGVDLG